jgi:hypothetical protein
MPARSVRAPDTGVMVSPDPCRSGSRQLGNIADCVDMRWAVRRRRDPAGFPHTGSRSSQIDVSASRSQNRPSRQVCRPLQYLSDQGIFATVYIRSSLSTNTAMTSLPSLATAGLSPTMRLRAPAADQVTRAEFAASSPSRYQALEPDWCTSTTDPSSLSTTPGRRALLS